MSVDRFVATAKGKFSGGDLTCRCALGKGGVVAAQQKREGDGASPAGVWALRRVFYRPDRVARPETNLPCVPLKPGDGWCDEPDHPLYNRPVSLPFSASYEALWREDGIYDYIIELSHNADPVQPGLGSAIFFHLARPDYSATEGCVAIAQEHMLRALAQSGPETTLEIVF